MASELKSGSVILVDKGADLKKILAQSQLPVLVDFSASWCQPCQLMKPMLKRIAQDYKDQLLVVEVDSDELTEEELKYYNVTGLPHFGVFKNNVALRYTKGAMEQDKFLEWLTSGELSYLKKTKNQSGSSIAQEQKKIARFENIADKAVAIEFANYSQLQTGVGLNEDKHITTSIQLDSKDSELYQGSVRVEGSTAKLRVRGDGQLLDFKYNLPVSFGKNPLLASVVSSPLQVSGQVITKAQQPLMGLAQVSVGESGLQLMNYNRSALEAKKLNKKINKDALAATREENINNSKVVFPEAQPELVLKLLTGIAAGVISTPDGQLAKFSGPYAKLLAKFSIPVTAKLRVEAMAYLKKLFDFTDHLSAAHEFMGELGLSYEPKPSYRTFVKVQAIEDHYQAKAPAGVAAASNLGKNQYLGVNVGVVTF